MAGEGLSEMSIAAWLDRAQNKNVSRRPLERESAWSVINFEVDMSNERSGKGAADYREFIVLKS